jgi:hypothetical protein
VNRPCSQLSAPGRAKITEQTPLGVCILPVLRTDLAGNVRGGLMDSEQRTCGPGDAVVIPGTRLGERRKNKKPRTKGRG